MHKSNAASRRSQRHFSLRTLTADSQFVLYTSCAAGLPALRQKVPLYDYPFAMRLLHFAFSILVIGAFLWMLYACYQAWTALAVMLGIRTSRVLLTCLAGWMLTSVGYAMLPVPSSVAGSRAPQAAAGERKAT